MYNFQIFTATTHHNITRGRLKYGVLNKKHAFVLAVQSKITGYKQNLFETDKK